MWRCGTVRECKKRKRDKANWEKRGVREEIKSSRKGIPLLPSILISAPN